MGNITDDQSCEVRGSGKTRRELTKVRMTLRLLGCQSFLVVVSQQLVQEIDRFIGDVSLVFWSQQIEDQHQSVDRAG